MLKRPESLETIKNAIVAEGQVVQDQPVSEIPERATKPYVKDV